MCIFKNILLVFKNAEVLTFHHITNMLIIHVYTILYLVSFYLKIE